MKFKFKIQEYQTEAVEAVVRVFEWQPFNDRRSYWRDSSLTDDSTVANFDQIFATYSPSTVRKVL